MWGRANIITSCSDVALVESFRILGRYYKTSLVPYKVKRLIYYRVKINAWLKKNNATPRMRGRRYFALQYSAVHTVT